MNRLMHWSLIATLAGTGVMGSSLVQERAAIAIPEADVLKRLERIPVFTVTDTKGTPILASIQNPQDKTKQLQIAYFFMGAGEAQTLVQRLKKDKPEVGKTAQVVTISLKEAYNIQTKSKAKKDELVFQFVPTPEQVTSAKAILEKNGQKIETFRGIPLFYAVGKGKDKGLLTLQQGKEKVIPFFFSQADLQVMLDGLKKQDAKISSNTTIAVTSLDRVVGSLFKEKGESAKQIAFMPSREAIQYVVQQQQKAGGNKAAPAAAPAQPKK